jgi:hypothetical protein
VGNKVQYMGRSEQYRGFAARCLEIARTLENPQTKAVMVQMAQVWSRLADETHGFTGNHAETKDGSREGS